MKNPYTAGDLLRDNDPDYNDYPRREGCMYLIILGVLMAIIIIIGLWGLAA